MYPTTDPISLDTFWPEVGKDDYPYSPYRRPSVTVPWATVGERPQYEADCAAGKLNKYGPEDIEYRYNAHGFRTAEFEGHDSTVIRVIAVGCSNTEGIGLPENHTWPFILQRRLEGLGHNQTMLNLGLGGSSNRHIALRTIRAMRTLKPHFAFIAWTYPLRLHYVYEDREMIDWWAPNEKEMASENDKMKLKRWYFEQMQSDPFDLHNLMTDIQMVNLASKAYDIPVCHSLLYLNYDIQLWVKKRAEHALSGWYHWKPTARDLVHPGQDCSEWVAAQMTRWMKENSYA